MKKYSFRIYYNGNDGFDYINFCGNSKREAKALYDDWCKDNGERYDIEDIEVVYDESVAAEYGENYGTPEEYYEKNKLPERLFWMDLNDSGIDEIGYLLTMEQLCEELPETGSAFVWGNIVPAGKMTPEGVDKLLSEKKGIFEGEYSANITFTVREVKDREDLFGLLTWEDYDFTNGTTAVELNTSYPSYVPERFRLSACVHGGEPGWTSENLPKSGDRNPTVVQYATELRLGMISGLCYDYTAEERAAIEISQALQSDDLTLETFVEILDSYHLPLPSFQAVEIEWDANEDELEGLPEVVLIPKGIYEMEEISNYLTETTEFCNKGFLIAEVEDMQRNKTSFEEEMEL